MEAKTKLVFLDANAIIYSLDKSGDLYKHVVSLIQRLLDEGVILCTSHHVIEEVLHVVQKITRETVTLSQIVKEIGKIPDLVLIEPAANLDFAQRYAVLSEKSGLGVNDALLLQLVIDAGITKLFSYDQKLVKQAARFQVSQVA